jgi:hypothetical protein
MRPSFSFKTKIKNMKKTLIFLAKILLFLIWFSDRAVHLILPHREHPKFNDWFKVWNTVKYSFIRLIIIGIIIFIFV